MLALVGSNCLERSGHLVLVLMEVRASVRLVLDPQGVLVCITLYKRGAEEVVRRLEA